MGIFSRLFRIGNAEANAAIDKIEDPAKMADQIIRELQANQQQAITGQAEIKATVMTNRAEEQKARQAASTWEKKTNDLLDMIEAGKLDEAKGTELANAAAKSAADATAQADQYASIAAKDEAALEVLSGRIKQIADRIEETKTRAKMIKSKAKIASTTETINKALSNSDTDGLMGTLDRMEEKVTAQDFRAQAYAEVGSITSTSQEIDSVLQSSTSSNALDAIKAKRAAQKTN